MDAYSKHLHVVHILTTKAQRAPWFPAIAPKESVWKVWLAQKCFIDGCTSGTVYNSPNGLKVHLAAVHGLNKEDS